MHNNYLTLPVVFAMISNHFPFTYGHAHAWLILVVLMAIGAWVRHYFNLRHVGRDAWWIPVTAGIGIVALAVAIRPDTSSSTGAGGAAVPFAQVQSIVAQRCAPCHSQHPTQPGYSAPPLGVVLETRQQIEQRADAIKALAVDTKAMPLANATHMTDAERGTLARWLASR